MIICQFKFSNLGIPGSLLKRTLSREPSKLIDRAKNQSKAKVFTYKRFATSRKSREKSAKRGILIALLII